MENNNKITLVIGHSFTMDGVNDIRGFDEGYVSLSTDSGKINVEGSDLKIESLSKEGGTIFISGNINIIKINATADILSDNKVAHKAPGPTA